MFIGLDNVVAAETVLSRVDGEAGRLVVRGRDLTEIAGRLSYEGMAALLWAPFLPELGTEGAVRPALGAARMDAFARLGPLRQAARELTPIEAVRAGLALLPSRGDAADAAAATATAAVMLAALQRWGEGKQAIEPDPALGHAADLARMLGHAPGGPAAVALETYLVTVADHGMNASTFAARVIASTRSDLVSIVTGALAALKGPLHGGAPGPVLDMLDDIAARNDIRGWLEAHMESGKRLMGFGHRIYRTRDPRADVLKAALAGLPHCDKGRDGGRVAFAERVEAEARALLAERHPERRLDTNVEFYTALLLEAVGVGRELFTPLFAVGRVLGWIGHALEQQRNGRLIRPRSHYVGPAPEGERPEDGETPVAYG